MDPSVVRQSIKEILIEGLNLEITPEEIDGTDLINEFQINSIDAISIFVYIENTFDIRIEDDLLNVELISSLDKITDFIVKKMSKTKEGHCGANNLSL